MSQVNNPYVSLLLVLVQLDLTFSLNSFSLNLVGRQNSLSNIVNTRQEQTNYLTSNENKLSKDPPPNKTEHHLFKSSKSSVV